MSAATVTEDLLQRFLAHIAIASPGESRVGIRDEEWAALMPLVRHEQIASWCRSRALEGTRRETARSSVTVISRTESIAQTAYLLRVGASLARTVALLRGIGCAAVPLKGAAFWMMANRYPFLAHRRTGDVDLLVEPGRAQDAWDALRDAGYQQIHSDPSIHEDHHHLPTLRSPLDVAVEIHRSASLFWSSEVSWDRLSRATKSVDIEGIPLALSPVTELFWHHTLHVIGNGGNGCSLRELLTSAALIAGPEPIDWELIQHRLTTDPVQDHDSRQRVPRAGVRRWIATAFALSGVDAPVAVGLPENPLPRLTRLLAYRARLLRTESGAPAVLDERLVRRLREAGRATFGLGVGRLPHWLPWWQRPKWFAMSVGVRVVDGLWG
jgi:hypothetical protein